MGVQETEIASPIHVVCNGLKALEVPRDHGKIEPRPKPYIVLLDLNIPKMNGIEFLHEVRALADRWQRRTSRPHLCYPVGAAMVDKQLC